MVIGICGKSGSGKSTLAKQIIELTNNKAIHLDIDKLLDDNKDKIVILDWLLLSITKYFVMCDFKVLLNIPYEIRKQRAITRDHITDSAFYLREIASIDFKREEFDYVLKDNQEEFIKKLVELL